MDVNGTPHDAARTRLWSRARSLILQLRRDVTMIRTETPGAQAEAAGNVFKEKEQ